MNIDIELRISRRVKLNLSRYYVLVNKKLSKINLWKERPDFISNSAGQSYCTILLNCPKLNIYLWNTKKRSKF